MANIRNVDLEVWRRFTAEVRLRGAPVGALLGDILTDWLRRNGHDSESRRARILRVERMFAHIQPERILSEELIADRRAEAAAECE